MNGLKLDKKLLTRENDTLREENAQLLAELAKLKSDIDQTGKSTINDIYLTPEEMKLKLKAVEVP
jgi:cell division protein FtsB